MSTEDDLLKGLARAAKEDADERDVEAAAKEGAYRPLDDAAKGRIVQRLQKMGREESGARDEEAPHGKASDEHANVITLSSRRGATLAVAVVLAVAAAIALFIRPMHEERATLPAYALVVSGGDRATRGAATPTDEIAVTRGSKLEIVLRPATSVKGEVAARAFLVQGDVAKEWSPPVSVSPDGAIRIDATGEMLAAGTWDVALAVGRPSELPSEPEAIVRAFAHRDEQRSWQLLVTRVRRVDAP
jgi:hypothetical protein